jgi:hypothetical protein
MRPQTTVSAAPAPSEGYLIQGQLVRLPVEVRHARTISASFPVAAAAMWRLLPPGLAPAELWPGRALCTIVAVEYLDNDLGVYNEVGVAFMVVANGERPRPFVDLVRGRAGAYIHRLPVNASFTCAAGSTIWGYPKSVEDITFADGGRYRSCTLRCGGAHALTLRVVRRGRRRFTDASFDSYSYRDGVLRRTPFTASGEGVGVRVGGARLELGAHPLAAELRTLGLPKRPLMSSSVEHMRARFGAPEVLARSR